MRSCFIKIICKYHWDGNERLCLHSEDRIRTVGSSFFVSLALWCFWFSVSIYSNRRKVFSYKQALTTSLHASCQLPAAPCLASFPAKESDILGIGGNYQVCFAKGGMRGKIEMEWVRCIFHSRCVPRFVGLCTVVILSDQRPHFSWARFMFSLLKRWKSRQTAACFSQCLMSDC